MSLTGWLTSQFAGSVIEGALNDLENECDKVPNFTCNFTGGEALEDFAGDIVDTPLGAEMMDGKVNIDMRDIFLKTGEYIQKAIIIAAEGEKDGPDAEILDRLRGELDNAEESLLNEVDGIDAYLDLELEDAQIIRGDDGQFIGVEVEIQLSNSIDPDNSATLDVEMTQSKMNMTFTN
jgi:hypothetical protein